MANVTEEHLLNLYRSLKKLRMIYAKMELETEHFPVSKENSQEIHKIDVLLPTIERYITTTLNRSIRDE